MGIEGLIGVLGFVATLLLVLVGLLNFSVFRKQVRIDEIKAMAELILNNFASALMHSAAFAEYPVRGVDRSIMFHMRRSPALREFLLENFDRFPFTGLTLLSLKNETKDGVEADLKRLIEAPDVDASEIGRRQELLQLYRNGENARANRVHVVQHEERR